MNLNQPNEDPSFMETGPGDALADEVEFLREELAEATEIIDDVEHVLMSMMNAEDMPEESIHAEKLEEIYDDIQRFNK